MRSPAAIAKTAQRRRDKRFKQRNKATIAPRATEQGLRGAAESKAFTFDLSLGGAMLHSDEAYAVGSVVRIRIVLSRTMESLNLEGEVKWVRRHPSENGYQIGVEFRHDRPQGFVTLIKELYDIRLQQDAAPQPEPEPNLVNRT
jgi:c-di-GMP-binding flagellar brake protein YcgR